MRDRLVPRRVLPHLTDDEEDDGHGGAEQCDQHEELEPENQTLNSNKSKTVF